ncbi:MAG: ABC transporter permease [Propionibacteriaceae bacterium]
MTTASPPVEAATSTISTGALARVARSYVLRRLLRAVFVVWVVATGVFFLVRLLPGNPVDVYINTQIAMYGKTYQEAAASASTIFTFDPNTPILQQYLDYLVGLVQGDLGNSILSASTTVAEKIAVHLPWTLFSAGLAMIISIAVGLTVGMVMAYRRGGIVDHAVTALGSVLHAIPNYLMAILFVVLLGVQLQLFDFAQMRGHSTPGVQPSFSPSFFGDALYHAALPIWVYVLTTVGTWSLVMKSSTTQVLDEDYVTVAKARGLSNSRIASAYVGRNAVLPMVAQIATQAAFVVGGAIFVEQTFGYDGIGIELFQAVNARDYPVIQGILLVITIVVVLANLVADLIYSVLDPRIRTDDRTEA